MQKIVLLALGAVAMTCSGCSSYYNFRFDSDPEAAKVYCGGNYFGTTPFYMHADKDTIDKNISGSYLDTGTPCDVIWPSGAQAQTPRYVKVRGDDIIVIHAQRPKDHPNLEMDYQIGLKNKQLNIQQQQVDVQQQQLDEMRRPHTTNCSQDLLGNVNCTSW